MKIDKWLSSLPSEYQMCLLFAFIGVTSWACQPLSPILASSLTSLFTFLGTLAGGFLTHGVLSRRTNNCQDLIGNTTNSNQ